MTVNFKSYPVIEVFGPTLQGEGAMAGKPTYFIRMGGCDYRCHWCDSSYAVLPKEVRSNSVRLTPQEIYSRIDALPGGPRWVTISGGNPALHELGPVVDNLHSRGYRVAVETQGTLYKKWLSQVDQLTISPKPPSSKMDDYGAALAKFHNLLVEDNNDRLNVCLKMPVFDDEDYEYAITCHKAYPEMPFYFSVVTRMGGLYGDYEEGIIDTNEDLIKRYRWLAEKVSRDPRAASTTSFPQLHALLWGHGRGF